MLILKDVKKEDENNTGLLYHSCKRGRCSHSMQVEQRVRGCSGRERKRKDGDTTRGNKLSGEELHIGGFKMQIYIYQVSEN